MDFLRLHEINIWEFRLHHSNRFRFKSQKDYTIFTDQMILWQDAHVYRKFEDDYNREKLQIKVSWAIATFTLSFILILLAFFVMLYPIFSYTLFIVSMLTFLTGHYLKVRYLKFAFAIDLSRELLTDDLIENVRKDLQSQLANNIG